MEKIKTIGKYSITFTGHFLLDKYEWYFVILPYIGFGYDKQPEDHFQLTFGWLCFCGSLSFSASPPPRQ